MMSVLKVHAFSPDPERGMPINISKAYYAKGLRGTRCGHMRKVAPDDGGVTCFFCLKKISATE